MPIGALVVIGLGVVKTGVWPAFVVISGGMVGPAVVTTKN